jgi:hypothetical protein
VRGSLGAARKLVLRRKPHRLERDLMAVIVNGPVDDAHAPLAERLEKAIRPDAQRLSLHVGVVCFPLIPPVGAYGDFARFSRLCGGRTRWPPREFRFGMQARRWASQVGSVR